jgi:hypothetical protein
MSLAQIGGSIRIPPMAAGGAFELELPLAWKMIYKHRRVVAFVTLGIRRRGQIGRSGRGVPARLIAVFAGADLTFPAKSST